MGRITGKSSWNSPPRSLLLSNPRGTVHLAHTIKSSWNSPPRSYYQIIVERSTALLLSKLITRERSVRSRERQMIVSMHLTLSTKENHERERDSEGDSCSSSTTHRWSEKRIIPERKRRGWGFWHNLPHPCNWGPGPGLDYMAMTRIPALPSLQWTKSNQQHFLLKMASISFGWYDQR